MKKLLSGNEAIALGAYEHGVKVASAYPGTPSTEVLENLSKYPGVYAEWAANEKVATDVAIGAAYAGKRSLTAMKMVGLNLAAESLFYSSYTGVEKGMVIVVADDPSMHSSQDEQDSRQYAKFAKVPMLEPADSQEAKDYMGYALEISERFDTPVLFRTTTRVAHTKTPVEDAGLTGPQAEGPVPPFPRVPTKYSLLPSHGQVRHKVIEQRLLDLKEFAETFPANTIEWGDTEIGIITGGLVYQNAKEVFKNASFLKLGMVYPLPEKMIKEFASKVKRLLVIEELDPFWEEQIKLMGVQVEGKIHFELWQEINAEIIRKKAAELGLIDYKAPAQVGTIDLPTRSPLLCPGCRHRGIFYSLKKLKAVVNNDIGCYGLGAVPPLSAVDTSGAMGSSTGVAHGVDKAGIAENPVAVMGDSTFFHTGLNPIINAVANNGNCTTVILDNHITAMTGHQDNPGTGKTLQGEISEKIKIEDVVRAIGVKDVHIVDPYDLKAVQAALKASFEHKGPSVVLADGPCVLKTREKHGVVRVDPERCNGCGLCLGLGCGAILRVNEKLVAVDELLCTGCTLCMQVCARKAMSLDEQGGR
jgi:indolepyruvate ferredoxin oxidoreductase alpha subunit